MCATWSRGRPAAGTAALKVAFCSPKKSPKMKTESTTVIATTPTLRTESGVAPASSRPTVTHEPTISASLAARPSGPSGDSNATRAAARRRTASHGRAPCIAQPSASAHPGGTSTRAIHVSTSALPAVALIAMTVTTTDAGATTAQPRPPSRSSHGGNAGRRQRDAERLGGVEHERVEVEVHVWESSHVSGECAASLTARLRAVRAFVHEHLDLDSTGESHAGAAARGADASAADRALVAGRLRRGGARQPPARAGQQGACERPCRRRPRQLRGRGPRRRPRAVGALSQRSRRLRRALRPRPRRQRRRDDRVGPGPRPRRLHRPMVAKAAATLLSAGALDGAIGRIARVAEGHPCGAAA